MSHAAWSAVTPYLRPTRRVIAFDTAGFGSTPPLPAGTPPTVHNLVDGLDRSLREIGIEVPVDIAGNSLGGSMALEAARRGIARSVVAISPAGLWKERGAPHVKYVFGSSALHGEASSRPVKGCGADSAAARTGICGADFGGKPAHARKRRASRTGRPRTIVGLRSDIRPHPLAIYRRRHRRSCDGGVWRSRLDPPEALTMPARASGTHQVGQKTRLGSCADVGRSRRCLATHPGGHPLGT